MCDVCSRTFEDERSQSIRSESSRGAVTLRWVFFFVFWCDFCVMFVHQRLKMNKEEISQYAVTPVAVPRRHGMCFFCVFFQFCVMFVHKLLKMKEEISLDAVTAATAPRLHGVCSCGLV